MVASVSASATVVPHLMPVANSREGVPPLVLGIEQFGLMTIPAAFIFSAVVMRLLCPGPSSTTWLSLDGDEVAISSFTGRMIVSVDSDDGPLALIVTTHAISRHKHLVDAAVTAGRLTLHNIATLSELRDSRARIVQAGVDERRRLVRDLHDVSSNACSR
jgi:signal transduction histidine kinase